MSSGNVSAGEIHISFNPTTYILSIKSLERNEGQGKPICLLRRACGWPLQVKLCAVTHPAGVTAHQAVSQSHRLGSGIRNFAAGKHATGPLPGSEPMDIFNPSGTEGFCPSLSGRTHGMMPWPLGWILVGIFFSPQWFVALSLPEVGICLVYEVCVRMLMSVREAVRSPFWWCAHGLRCLNWWIYPFYMYIYEMKLSCWPRTSSLFLS